MSIPKFKFTGSVALTIFRKEQGDYVKGVWVAGVETEVEIKANIQPLKLSEVMSLPESERQRSWWKVYSASEIRAAQEGDGGWDGDEFLWQGYRYRVMKVKNYSMGVLDHYCAYAARIPVSAGEEDDSN